MAHPLMAFMDRFFPTACSESVAWLQRLPHDTTPADAYARANEDWRRWARKARRWLDKGDRDALDALIPLLAGSRPPNTATRPLRALMSRLMGKRLVVKRQCPVCDGLGWGCRRCNEAGAIKEDAGHPADAWTARAYQAIGTTYGAGSPP